MISSFKNLYFSIKRLMFAISGMKIFRNKFGYCSLPSNFQISESQVLFFYFYVCVLIFFKYSAFRRMNGQHISLILIIPLMESLCFSLSRHLTMKLITLSKLQLMQILLKMVPKFTNINLLLSFFCGHLS